MNELGRAGELGVARTRSFIKYSIALTSWFVGLDRLDAVAVGLAETSAMPRSAAVRPRKMCAISEMPSASARAISQRSPPARAWHQAEFAEEGAQRSRPGRVAAVERREAVSALCGITLDLGREPSKFTPDRYNTLDRFPPPRQQ